MDNRDALWLVEYRLSNDSYRITRFAEPEQTVAYEDYWEYAVREYAVRDIVWNYGNAVKIILIKKEDGTVD